MSRTTKNLPLISTLDLAEIKTQSAQVLISVILHIQEFMMDKKSLSVMQLKSNT